MSKTSKKKAFESDPIKLIDTIDALIKKKTLTRPSAVQADKVFQLNEISKTINRLKRAKAEIPDELRRLRIELANDAGEYEKLNAAHAVRPVSKYGGGDIGPAQKLAYQVAGKFSLRQGAVGKIPQRPFAIAGFINSQHIGIFFFGEVYQKGVVRTPGH